MPVPPSALAALGWGPDLQSSLDSSSPGLVPARVVLAGRDAWRVDDGAREHVVGVTGRLRRDAGPAGLPVTGDWVALRGGDPPVVDAVLPRRTVLSRKAAGLRTDEQVLAAGVDVVALCAPAAAVNIRRLERELTAAWSSGATPLVLVTKTDLVDHPGDALADAAVAAVGVEVLGVSAPTGDGVAAVRDRLAPGSTTVLLGPSGAGKTTLVNALGGGSRATAEVRADGRGRHTTTARELVRLPGGALLLDTPGLRELALWDEPDGLAGAFGDVDGLAARCRFADCAHATEPGCAVLAAVDDGTLTPERLDSWRRLHRELAWVARRHDARLLAQERRRWKALTRQMRARPGG